MIDSDSLPPHGHALATGTRGGQRRGRPRGTSVSLSGNGKTVVMGAPTAGYDNEIRTGQVKVYRIDAAGSSWEPLGESIYGDYGHDWFGASADISHDGITIVIGAPADHINGIPGYVRVFSINGGNVTGIGALKKIGRDITGEAVGDEFGRSVSISDDGRTIAAGAPINNGKSGDDAGHARVYRMYDSWMQLGKDIEGEGHENFSGRSVSLSGNGDTVAIGSPGFSYDKGGYNGKVRVFVVK